MRLRVIVIVSLGVIAAVTIWLALTVGHEQSELRASPARGSVDQASELRGMQQELGALRSQVAQLAHGVAVPAVQEPSDPAKAASELSAPERKEASRQEQRRAVAFLDAQVGSQGRDPAWSAQVQGKLNTALAAESSATLRSVACGAALCRADLTLSDPAKLDHFIEKLPDASLGAFQMFYERDGDHIATTIFVARDGQPLPRVAKRTPTKDDR